MIKLIKHRLRWSEVDMLQMTDVLGVSAADQQAPPIPSIIKRATKLGVLVSPKVLSILTRARAEIRRLEPILEAQDIEVVSGYRLDLLERAFAHQRIALAFMSFRDAYLLADQPGVGKTPVAIMWADQRAPKRILVVCPNSAKRQWRREIKRWMSVNRPIRIVEGKVERQNQLMKKDGWIIAHWESLVHAADGALARKWDVVILDEAHAIRNREAQRTSTAFSLEATYKLAMTGHPFFNDPTELWSILHFLYPSLYSAFWRFVNMHVRIKPKYFGGFDIEGVRNRSLLRWELKPFVIRRTKGEVYKNLPPITRIPRYVDLPPSYQKEYERLKKEFFVKLESSDEGGERVLPIVSILARTTRVRQYLVDPDLLRGAKESLKYPIVHELIEELDGPPVIFTSFRQAAIRLSTYLSKRKLKTSMITGGMKSRDLGKVQDQFRDGKVDALIVVTQAGGTALNLGKYGYVIFLDMPWTHADLEQAEGRVDRPEEGTGRLVPTTSYRIIIRGTYEERLERLIESKQGKFDEVFTVGEIKKLFV